MTATRKITNAAGMASTLAARPSLARHLVRVGPWLVLATGVALLQAACATRQLSVPEAPEGARCVEDGQCVQPECGGEANVCVGGRCVIVAPAVTPCLQPDDLVIIPG